MTRQIKKSKLFGLTILLILLAITVMLELRGSPWPRSLNLEVSSRLNLSTCHGLMKIVSISASLEASLLYLIFLVWLDIHRLNDISERTLGLTISLLLAMFVVLALKVLVKEPRPQTLLMGLNPLTLLKEADLYSFPSGHVTRATVFSYYLSRKKSLAQKLVLALWTSLVALSRIVLKAHWLIDVLASAIIGVFISAVVELFEEEIKGLYRQLIKLLGC